MPARGRSTARQFVFIDFSDELITLNVSLSQTARSKSCLTARRPIPAESACQLGATCSSRWLRRSSKNVKFWSRNCGSLTRLPALPSHD
jgi:hypothetical protein